jgi:hypothetical protein
MNDDDELNWPRHYNPGPSSHVHALGVMVLNFASFQAYMEILYLQIAQKKMPFEEAKALYSKLSDKEKPKALKEIFESWGSDATLIARIDNLIEYYEYCIHARNNVAHAELYPASFGKDDTLYLSTKESKLSTKTIYIKLSLREIRELADNIRAGTILCIDISLFLRFLGQPIDQIPSAYRAYAVALPKPLSVPSKIDLALRPKV